jgi:hypothetical protein
MSGQTSTKLTTKTNYQNNDAGASFPFYREVCDIFSKGFEKLEGSKLSWKGKEHAYGKAIKTIIAQAVDCLGGYPVEKMQLMASHLDREAGKRYEVLAEMGMGGQ